MLSPTKLAGLHYENRNVMKDNKMVQFAIQPVFFRSNNPPSHNKAIRSRCVTLPKTLWGNRTKRACVSSLSHSYSHPFQERTTEKKQKTQITHERKQRDAGVRIERKTGDERRKATRLPFERVHCINQSVFSIRLLLDCYIKLKSETEMVK